MSKLWIDKDIWNSMTPEQRAEVERFRDKMDRKTGRKSLPKPIIGKADFSDRKPREK